MSDSKISLTYSIKNEKSLSPTLKVRNHTVSEHLPADNREALYPNRSSDRITDKSKNNRSIEFSVDLINSHGIVGKTKKRAKKLTPLKHGFTRIHHRNQISLGLHHSDFVKNSKTVSKKSLWKNIFTCLNFHSQRRFLVCAFYGFHRISQVVAFWFQRASLLFADDQLCNRLEIGADSERKSDILSKTAGYLSG